MLCVVCQSELHFAFRIVVLLVLLVRCQNGSFQDHFANQKPKAIGEILLYEGTGVGIIKKGSLFLPAPQPSDRVCPLGLVSH